MAVLLPSNIKVRILIETNDGSESRKLNQVV